MSRSTASASLGQSVWPMILRNWRSASSMPAAVHRRHMSPFCQRLTLRLVRRTVSIIDSHGLGDASVRLSWPATPSLVIVSVSAMPSRSDAAAPGSVRASSSASTRNRSSACSWSSSAQAPRKPAADAVALVLGQVLEDLALLVAHAPLHRRVDAKDVVDG